MENRKDPLTISNMLDDVVVDNIMPRLDYHRLMTLGLTSKHFYNLFKSVSWQNLISRDFNISLEELKKITFHVDYLELYRRIKKLATHRLSYGPIKNFCESSENHEKLLACLANNPNLLHKLPIEEDSIWLNVALVADCPVVYETIFKRHPQHQNRFATAVVLGNVKAVDWCEANPTQPVSVRQLDLNLNDAIAADSLELLQRFVQRGGGESIIAPSHYYSAINNNSINCAHWLKDVLSRMKKKVNDTDALAYLFNTRSQEMWELVLGHSGVELNGQPDPKLLAYIEKAKAEDTVFSWCLNYTAAIFNSGNDELIQLALKQFEGVMTEHQQNACMRKAIEKNNIQAVKWLIVNFPIVISSEHVSLAVKAGNLDLTRYFVDYSPTYFADLIEDRHQANLLKYATTSGNYELLRFIITKMLEETPNAAHTIPEFVRLQPFQNIRLPVDNGDDPEEFDVGKGIATSMCSYLENELLRDECKQSRDAALQRFLHPGM